MAQPKFTSHCDEPTVEGPHKAWFTTNAGGGEFELVEMRTTCNGGSPTTKLMVSKVEGMIAVTLDLADVDRLRLYLTATQEFMQRIADEAAAMRRD